MSLRWRRQAPSQRRLSRQGGPPLGVGGVEVLHRGRGGDAEYAYEVDGVGGVAGLGRGAGLGGGWRGWAPPPAAGGGEPAPDSAAAGARGGVAGVARRAWLPSRR